MKLLNVKSRFTRPVNASRDQTRVEEQDRQRSKVRDDEPADRARQEQAEPDPWPSVESGREPPARRRRDR